MNPLALLWQRQLPVFHVRMAGCGGCGRVVDDFLRDGKPVVAVECSSPRHARLLVVTGCWTPQLGEGALSVIAQAPSERRLALVGDCALGRGAIADILGVTDSVGHHIEPDFEIQGCPISIEALAGEVRDVAR